MTWPNAPQGTPGTPPADHLVPEAGGHPARLASAAAELRQAAEILTAAYARLDAAWQPLSPVGGWLSADADALAGEEED